MENCNDMYLLFNIHVDRLLMFPGANFCRRKLLAREKICVYFDVSNRKHGLKGINFVVIEWNLVISIRCLELTPVNVSGDTIP